MYASKTLSGTIKTSGTAPLINIILCFGTRTFTLALTSSLTHLQFVTTSATLIYDSEDQLTGRRYVNVTIGDSANFIFENGPIANGTLEIPIVHQGKYKESGVWNKGE